MKTSEWTSVKDRLPMIGQTVILFANGVVQEEMYMLGTTGHAPLEYFWNRKGNAVCPLLSPGQMRALLPEPPEEE